MSENNEKYYIKLDKDNKDQILPAGEMARANFSNVKDAYRDQVIIRDDFNRKDYSYLRPDAELPNDPKKRIVAAMQAYDIGIVRNVIDMMGDFVCKGVDLAHKNKTIENFCKEWWKRIKGQDRSERISNLLFRTGNVILKRSYANLTPKQTKELRAGEVADGDIEPEQTALRSKYRIPWKYTVQNPAALEVLGGDIDLLLGKEQLKYGVRMDETLIEQINQATDQNRFNKNRPVLVQSLFNISDVGKPDIFPLPPEDTISLFYKKDDWQLWATPMLFTILPDIQVYNKLRLADLAALDGACNYARIFKLGNIDAELWPSEAAIAHLSGILQSNSAGGPMDIVWGPDIDIIESKVDIAKFLDNSKYTATLTSIYTALGVPPVLVGLGGTSTTGSAFFVLKTLIERLQYVRNVITDFWQNELNILAKEMNFSSPPELVFDMPTIADESTANKLLVEMLDRNIISTEAVLERTNFYPVIEEARLKREKRKRESEKMPGKVSSLQLPEQAILMADKNTEGQIKVAKAKPQPKGIGNLPGKPKGKSGQGREKGQKDSSKRKPKTLKPRTKALANAVAWAKESQKTISDILTPIYLKSIDKKNLRQLTDDESASLESLKFKLLVQCEPHIKITDSSLLENISKEIDNEFYLARESILVENPDKSIEYIRDLEASTFATLKIDNFMPESV